MILSLYFIHLRASNELVPGDLWVDLWHLSFQVAFWSQSLILLG